MTHTALVPFNGIQSLDKRLRVLAFQTCEGSVSRDHGVFASVSLAFPLPSPGLRTAPSLRFKVNYAKGLTSCTEAGRVRFLSSSA